MPPTSLFIPHATRPHESSKRDRPQSDLTRVEGIEGPAYMSILLSDSGSTKLAARKETLSKLQANNVATPMQADVSSHVSLTNSPSRTTLIVSPTFNTATYSSASSATFNDDNGLIDDPSHSPSTTTVYVYPSTSFDSAINPSSHPTSQLILEPSHSASATSSVRMVGDVPLYQVALASVGGLVGLLFGIVMLLKCCRRNKRRELPRPSRPILQESPLFGGKERFSRGGIWRDPSFNNLLSAHKDDGWRPLSRGKSLFCEKNQDGRESDYLNVDYGANNAASRPVSPSSIYTTAAPSTLDVGIALEFPVPPLTKVTQSVTQPLNVKNKSSDAKSNRRRSRSSVYFVEPSPTLTETEAAFNFQTPRAAPNPTIPKPALKTSNSARSQTTARKVVPHDQPTISIKRTPSGSKPTREKAEPFEYALTTVKSAERRDRDTKALTSALGLASPHQPALCFSPVSIYPDDSLSVAHGRNGRPHSEAAPSEMPSPVGTTAALGSFMLQEYPSNATLASMTGGGRMKDRPLSYAIDPFAGGPPELPVIKKSGSKGANLKTVGDRPPRVPSPPTLPSLAQMALGNADPDYRSPTYSIYGLYEAQRKSKTSIAGM